MAAPSRTCIACESSETGLERTVRGFEVHACRVCGLRFVPPDLLAAVDYDELYTAGGDYGASVEEADRMGRGELIEFPRARRATLEELRRHPPATLLEVGCGVGNFLRWTDRMGIRSFGIDPSVNATDMARRNLPSCPIETGILSRDAFPGRSFDVICAWEVIEHISDVMGFMDTLRERLNPGGLLFMSTPNHDCAVLWRDMEQDPRSRPPVHVTFWNARSLQRFLDGRFERTRIDRLSVPANAARRSGGPAGRWLVHPLALLCPSQRLTLRSRSRKAGEGRSVRA